jgi:hypothetical protein
MKEGGLGGAEGLYYYGARWYDPSLGRFAQADSIIPGDSGKSLPFTIDYHEVQFLEKLNKGNTEPDDDSETKLDSVPSNTLAFGRYSYSFNKPLTYIDQDGHFAFLVPILAGAVIGGAISTITYAVTANVTGQQVTLAGAAGAFAGGAIAGAVSIIATPLAGTLLQAAGAAAAGTGLVVGTAAVNAAGGALSYFVGGYTQNIVDSVTGNIPTFQPTVGGAIFNATVAGGISPLIGTACPVANNTISTINQASYFIPGRTVGTLFSTENARHMYAQAFIATGIGTFMGTRFAD